LRIRDPDIYLSRIARFRISDPKTATKERVENVSLFWSHKFHKIENYFVFGILKKKFEAIFKEL
jgi:hypothetical protein